MSDDNPVTDTETPPPPEEPKPETPALGPGEPKPETPAPVVVEVEPQKVPSFANWTQEEKEKYHERLERLERLATPKEEARPPIEGSEPKPEPKPRKRGLRYKRK